VFLHINKNARIYVTFLCQAIYNIKYALHTYLSVQYSDCYFQYNLVVFLNLGRYFYEYASHPHTSLFRINQPGHTLTQTGNQAFDTQIDERALDEELQNHDQPYVYTYYKY
jgi:hypothetical protein